VAFGGVYVGELIQHLHNVADDGRMRTRYLAVELQAVRLARVA
jgi:hypothetical protein